MNKPTHEELVKALELMALQYLKYDDILDHKYMAAGEHCLDCLAREGLVVGEGRRYEWTGKSEFFYK